MKTKSPANDRLRATLDRNVKWIMLKISVKALQTSTQCDQDNGYFITRLIAVTTNLSEWFIRTSKEKLKNIKQVDQ